MRVGLVQINMELTWSNPRRRDGEPAQSFGMLPYSIGLLQSYAERHAAGPHEFLVPIHRRIAIADAVGRLAGADIVGFSTYVWNVRLSLAIARALKERRPDVLVVFGGPQVPDHAEEFLRTSPWVDVVCHGEGEATFTALLDRAAARDFGDVPGCSYLTPAGAYERHAVAPRIRDLEEIPSPYLGGTFAPLIAANPDEAWVMMWETNRGCPFSCTFCDWGSATASKVFRFGMERIEREVGWMAAERVGFVICCDANFGMLPRDVEITRAVVAAKERYGFPFSLSVQNTKNATERAYAIQKLLHESMNTIGVTISLQSTNPGTLENIRRRNISSEHFRELQRRFAADGVYTYTDIILGLPGETYSQFADGVAEVIGDGQHNHVQFHNCSLLPNAEMAQPRDVERFGIRTVPQIVRNAHDAADLTYEVEEYLDTVVATDAMPPADWRRAKVFAWLSNLLYFDRMLQLPIALLAARHGVSPRTSIERIAASARPTLAGLVADMTEHARSIQASGGLEYVAAPAFGNMIWPADQHALISLVVGGELEAFYAEAAAELAQLLNVPGDELALEEAIALNRAMLRVPFAPSDVPIVLSHPILEHHRALLAGRAQPPLNERLVVHVVDRSGARYTTLQAWLEHLAWCDGKDKRGYLYDVRIMGRPAAVAA
jgi:radical SAM superfamily enzyme YgiQ (UPF0313 family)